jgi:hypothetical protein
MFALIVAIDWGCAREEIVTIKNENERKKRNMYIKTNDTSWKTLLHTPPP